VQGRGWAGVVLLGSLLWGRPALAEPLQLNCEAALAAAQRQQQELEQRATTLAVL
jgi:hypothetical protein